MKPFIPVSCAEVVDKITILEIKLSRVESKEARANVENELAQLSEIARAFGFVRLKAELRALNEKLWDLQNALAGYARRGEFGDSFVQCALAMFRGNEERASIKRSINEALESELIEEKQYG